MTNITMDECFCPECNQIVEVIGQQKQCSVCSAPCLKCRDIKDYATSSANSTISGKTHCQTHDQILSENAHNLDRNASESTLEFPCSSSAIQSITLTQHQRTTSEIDDSDSQSGIQLEDLLILAWQKRTNNVVHDQVAEDMRLDVRDQSTQVEGMSRGYQNQAPDISAFSRTSSRRSVNLNRNSVHEEYHNSNQDQNQNRNHIQVQGQNQNRIQDQNLNQIRTQVENQNQNRIQDQNLNQIRTQVENQNQNRIQVQKQNRDRDQSQTRIQDPNLSQNRIQHQYQTQNRNQSQHQSRTQGQSRNQNRIQGRNQNQNRIQGRNQNRTQIGDPNQNQNQDQNHNLRRNPNRDDRQYRQINVARNRSNFNPRLPEHTSGMPFPTSSLSSHSVPPPFVNHGLDVRQLGNPLNFPTANGSHSPSQFHYPSRYNHLQDYSRYYRGAPYYQDPQHPALLQMDFGWDININFDNFLNGNLVNESRRQENNVLPPVGPILFKTDVQFILSGEELKTIGIENNELFPASFSSSEGYPLSLERIGEQQRIIILLIKLQLEQMCSICISDFEEKNEGLQLKCGHIFHQDCILQWFRHRSSCPECRMDLSRGEQNGYEAGLVPVLLRAMEQITI